MEMSLRADARPQARLLLFATIISIALWFLPFAGILTYPFRLFVTFIHEGGHALAAILTGNSVKALSIAWNASGETYTTNGGIFSQVLISSAGYLGAMSFGALLLVLIRRAVAARWVLMGATALVAILTVGFGLFEPLFSGSLSLLSGVPFTLVAGLLISTGLFLVGRFAGPQLASFFVSFLAVQCVLNALADLKTVFFLSAPGAPNVPTDAVNMANATHIPAMFWAVSWIVLGFLILSVAMRFYVSCRDRKGTQPDLPFEDPLEV